MKKLFTIFVLLFVLKSHAQSYYKNLFDEKHYDTSLGNSDSPDQAEFSWGVPAHMEALVIMYEKTHDVKYAKNLIRCIGNVIDRRDDLREQTPSLGLSNISDYRGSIGPAWSTNRYNLIANDGKPYSHLVHSANITYPMAKFAAIVKNDNGIQNIVYQSGGRYNDMTFKNIADDLKQKVKETLNYHKDQWHEEPNDSIGYYIERDSINVSNNPPLKYKGEILPFNMQSSMGRVLVQMYRATEDTIYLTKVRQLSNFIKLNTVSNPNLQSNIWKYWKETALPEDISHGGVTASFPYECNKYNIKKNGLPIYTDSDIQAYANTFTKDIYKSPLLINGRIGDNAIWDIKYDAAGSLAYDDYVSYMWLYLSKQNSPLYQMVADIQAAEKYYSHVITESSLALALLANYENFIVPVSTEHRYGEGSDWRGVAKGNFDGGSNEQFVVLRNFDGMMGTMKPLNKGITSVTNSRVCGDSTYNWKGLATGDFFGDSKSEIIALSDHADFNKNGFYIYKIENNQIIESTQFTGFGEDSKWVGVAAGNFISGGKTDFIAVRNYNKEVRVYKFNGTNPELVYFNQLNLPANSKIKAVAAGNLDHVGKDEIVLLIDADDYMQNGVYVYSIDDNGVMTLIDKSIGFESASDWKGLAVGNLDGIEGDEIVAHRNFDGNYKIFKLKELNGIKFLDGVGIESFPVSQTQDNVMCFGNFDPSSKNDELVTLRKDGGIVMFSAAQVVKTPPQASKQSNPCQDQDELPEVLFSFLNPLHFNN